MLPSLTVMQKQRAFILLIVILVVAAITILIKIPLELGLDLKGGAQLTIQVKPTAEVTDITPDDLTAVKSVISNRVNALGVSEPVVQTAGKDKILVQLSGVTDPEQAERVLGGTAQLEFRNQKQGTEEQFIAEYQIQRQLEAQLALFQQIQGSDGDSEQLQQLNESLRKSNEAIASLFESVGLTGKNLKNARPQPTQAGNRWEVAIEFDGSGGEKFAELTKNLAGTGRSIGIFLDDALISAPTVGPEFADTGIAGGRAVITGNFTIESANDLAVQIRGGSLPFPVEVVENRTVGATLGQDSIKRSIYAGIAGLLLVLIFVAVYYRLPGLIADVALVIYTILTLGCYALVGVTLTLPGMLVLFSVLAWQLMPTCSFLSVLEKS